MLWDSQDYTPRDLVSHRFDVPECFAYMHVPTPQVCSTHRGQKRILGPWKLGLQMTEYV